MQFADVAGQRTHPKPGLRGTCPFCGGGVLAKCGRRVVWHWAHARTRRCDSWWENETEWHRAWKALFPEESREVVLFDDATGEKHVADVRTAAGLVVELQHSAMTPAELRSREAFYRQMVWIVDAIPFSTRFEVLPGPLPHPASRLHEDVVFFPQLASAFWLRSEKVEGSKLVQMHPSSEIIDRIDADYQGHHFFKWNRPREVWYEANAPVYLDFGTDELLRLDRIGQFKQLVVQRVPKDDVVKDLQSPETKAELRIRPNIRLQQTGSRQPPRETASTGFALIEV